MVQETELNLMKYDIEFHLEKMRKIKSHQYFRQAIELKYMHGMEVREMAILCSGGPLKRSKQNNSSSASRTASSEGRLPPAHEQVSGKTA